MDTHPATNTATTEARLPGLFTIGETRDVLRLSRWSVYQLVNEGHMNIVRVNRRSMIPIPDVQAVIDPLVMGRLQKI